MNNEKIISSNVEVFYTYDGNGNFNPILIPHGEVGANEVFMQQMWDHFNERFEKARKEVIAGIRSPLYYHMERTRMDVMTLAIYMGYTPLKVKRHFKPSVYKRLKPKVKAKYADIFETSIDKLDNINLF